MKLLAIDPGQAGGMAWTDEGSQGSMKMPATETDVATELSAFDGFTVYMEKIHTMPKQGIASAGKFMEGYGFLKGVCAAKRLRLVLVTPQAWQKALGLGTSGTMSKTQWKNKLKAEAQRLYPREKVTLATADALLILEYARRVER